MSAEKRSSSSEPEKPRLFDPNERDGSTIPPASQITVRQIGMLHLADKEAAYRAGKVSKAAWDNARHYVLSFCEMFGKQLISQCRKVDLRRWLDAHPEWQSPHTKSNALGAVCHCFKSAADEDEIIERNPYPRPRRLIETPGPRTPMFPDEYRAWRRAARLCAGGRGKRKRPSSGPMRYAVAFLRWHGARTSEMRSALWEKLNLETGALWVKNKTASATGYTERLIVLRPHFLRLVRKEWEKRGRPTSGNIFLSSRRRPWTKEFSKRFKNFAKIAGIRPDATAYCLRHGFTVALIEKEKTDQQIMAAMGWTDPKRIHWYGRWARKHVDFLRRASNSERGKNAEQK